MKTDKEKSKLKKSSKEKNKTKNENDGKGEIRGKKNNIAFPREDEIREKALEIYQQRIERGEQGTAADDWHEAEQWLRS